MPFLVPIIILIIAVIIRLLPKKHHDIVVDMSYEEMISNIRPFAQAKRAPSRFGAGISIGKSKRRLEKAYIQLSKRVKQGEELYEFERQFYENYHLIRKLLVKSLYKGYSTLPHKNLEPRIVSVAHFIVNGCSKRLTTDKVVAAIKAFNKYTPLYYRELCMFKNALLYTLVKDLSIIANRSSHYAKMRSLAEQTEDLNPTYYQSDSYLYYYSEKWGNPKEKFQIVNSDIVADNIESAFVTALIDNCVIVGSIIDSIRNIDRILEDETLLDITPSHQMLLHNDSYKMMDIDSIKAYLFTIGRISDELNVSEKAVIESALKLEGKHNIHFGEFLFGNTRRLRKFIKYGKDILSFNVLSNTSALYIFAVLILSVAFAVAFYDNVPIALLIALALIKPIEHLYSFIVKYEHRFMPRMGYKHIPPEGETLVVVSELLTDKKSVSKAFKHLKIISENSKDNNVSYLLLADLKESKNEVDDTDSELIEAIKTEYEQSDKARLNILLRRRVKAGNKYSGKERKRGALMELARYLIYKESDQFIYQGKDIKKPEFLILLDADNELLPGTINRSINSMLHPLNEKYDLLTFGCATNMHSIKTLYSKKYLSQCGIPDYGKSSDYIYDLSMNSIFCGKGIVRLENFYDKLKDAFPDNRILSHDIIEGAILKSGAMQDRVYEDAPSNIVSDIERKSRWMRGDFQLIPYIFRREPVSIRGIYRYTIFSNTINALLPAVQLALFILALFYGSVITAVFLGVTLLLSSLLDVFGALRGLTGNTRLRYVFLSIYNVLRETVCRILFLPFNAVNGLYLFLLTMIRLTITKRNLLEWKTYSSSQGISKFNKYATIITPSFIVMTLLSVALINYPMFLIYTAVFMAYSLIVYLGGKEISETDSVSKDNKATLMMYAEDIYRYFDNFIKEDNHYLVPDNYQVYPYKGERYSTSPSNIGLSILAIVSAHELGIINIEEATNKVTPIINTLSNIKKWHGHLYNWYNTKTLEVLYPNYVSSVDSANLIACLTTARQLFLSKGKYNLAKSIDDIIIDTDFSKLYDNNSNLFYIGYNEAKGELSGHYDLMASESRILSYIATSNFCDIIHWMKLSRECVALRGNTLVSWSGTSFEYLMPELFLNTPKYSLIGRSVRNVVREQIKSKVRGLWGISEGGFFRFDELLNYEYKAFGLRELSLRSDYSRAVITPYSSFLALEYNPRAVVNNLNNIRNHSMYGEYGFYEALDMYSNEKPVNSFMAHHLGMSIASICNYLAKGAIRNLFNSSNDISATKLILTESIITSKFDNVKDDSFVYAKKTQSDSVTFNPIKALPEHNILSNGAYSVLTDDYGNGYSVYGDIFLNRFRRNKDTGFYSYIHDMKNDKLISPSYSPLRDSLDDYTVTYNAYSSLYLNKANSFSMEIFVPPCFCGEVRKYNYYNKSDEGKELRVGFYSELNVNTDDRDNAHPVFNDMFISTAFLKDRNAIIAKRKMLDGSGNIYAALIIKGFDDIRVDTDRMTFIGRGNDSSSPNIMTKDYNYTGESVGEVLYPCFGAYSDIPIPPKSNIEFYTACVISHSYDKLLEAINEANSMDFVKHAEMSSKVTSVNFYSKCIKVLNNDLRKLADMVLNQSYKVSQLKVLASNDTCTKLCSLGLDPMTKFIILEYKGEGNDSLVTQYVGMIKYLNKANIKVKLVILYNDCDMYHQNMRGHIDNLVFRERGGEIYPVVINKNDIDNDLIGLLYKLACGIAGKLKYFNNSICYGNLTKQLEAKALDKDRIIYTTGEGGFAEDGGYIVKPYNGSTTLLPYSNVIGGFNGGTIITADGAGFTYLSNSREQKITIWNNDPVSDKGSEFIYLLTKQGQIRINSIKSGLSVKHSRGITTFSGTVKDIRIMHEQYMIKSGSIKVFDTILINDSAPADIELAMVLDIALGWREEYDYLYYEKIDDDKIVLFNAKTKQRVMVKVFDKGSFIMDKGRIKPRDIKGDSIDLNNNASASGIGICSAYYKVKLNKYHRLTFMVGDPNELINYIIANLDNDKRDSLDYYNSLSTINIDSSDKYLDLLFNEWLLYQVVSSRINGKCGYYQAGGAIGFRDQLQDCLALIYSNTKYVREHILKAAAHQYKEGDVMHWWHYDRYGVRTRIKDDSVFMVYVVCEYIEATGDESILEEQAPYLESCSLSDNEHNRFENPCVSSDTESIKYHLLRAIKYVLQYGEHDLILIGGGDWNDALDAVGLKSRGESVWLSQFLYMTLKRFINYVDNDTKLELLKHIDKLKEAVNSHGYDGKWFRRIFTDKGEWLGSKNSEVCKIDLISQAFSALSEIGDEDKIGSALQHAESLIDYDNGMIKLLDPPFDDSNWYGYISAYPKGIRENGGQYTHAAIWYIMALFKVGRIDDAYKLLKLINPVEKCASKEKSLRYMGEPYVIAADVYSSPSYKGRMGWNFYTGSAAWCYKMIVENIAGIKLISNVLHINPKLPKELKYLNVEYRYKSSIYRIMINRSNNPSMLIDGVEVVNGNQVLLQDNGKVSEIIVSIN